MSDSEWVSVTREELEAYVKSYPRRLARDVCAIGEPPVVSFNDFTLGNWPESRVAVYMMEGYGPEGGYQVRKFKADQ